MPFALIFTDEFREVSTLSELKGKTTARKTYLNTNAKRALDSACLDGPFRIEGIFPGRAFTWKQIYLLRSRHGLYEHLKCLWYNLEETAFDIWPTSEDPTGEVPRPFSNANELRTQRNSNTSEQLNRGYGMGITPTLRSILLFASSSSAYSATNPPLKWTPSSNK
jgi:hypothetical protein